MSQSITNHPRRLADVYRRTRRVEAAVCRAAAEAGYRGDPLAEVRGDKVGTFHQELAAAGIYLALPADLRDDTAWSMARAVVLTAGDRPSATAETARRRARW